MSDKGDVMPFGKARNLQIATLVFEFENGLDRQHKPPNFKQQHCDISRESHL